MTTDYLAPSENWDLDSLCSGGPGGVNAATLLAEIESSLQSISKTIETLPVLGEGDGVEDRWARALLALEHLDAQIVHAFAVAECVLSADVEHAEAKVMSAQMSDVTSRRNQLSVPIRAKLASASASAFKALIERDDVGHQSTYLSELRARAEISMKPALEDLYEALARDGFHAWGRLYDTVSGALRVHLERGDGREVLSVEQARRLLESPIRETRISAAEAIDRAWDSRKKTFTAALNHINGFRQIVYSRRGIDEIEIPARLNRISRQSLDTMFDVIDGFKPKLAQYLNAKAGYLGLEQLAWYDVDVPLGESGGKVSYRQAQEFIVRHFDGFSNDLGDFARMAFKNRWIEAEDRAGKRHGGFCADFPLSHESRIFMTYGGTAGSVQTLAHELGHAYHSWLLRDQPLRRTSYPATLAETASTFAESIIREAAYDAAENDDVRLGMLDRKLSDAVGFVMNIPARYRFERQLYQTRAHKELTPERLTEMTVEAFSHCHDNALSEYERLFWCSKLHFYISDFPFYNFPYAVGFLFSFALYERARREGPSFAAQYRHALELTGYQSCEDVARKALGVELTEPEFWQSALDVIGRDVDLFSSLCKTS